MSFFKSEVVRAEMTEISELQEEVYQNVFRFPSMSKEEKLFHVSLLEKLLNKQQILYTRLSLSDDPEAKEMKNQMRKSLQGMGFPEGTDMPSIFSAMDETIGKLKESVD